MGDIERGANGTIAAIGEVENDDVEPRVNSFTSNKFVLSDRFLAKGMIVGFKSVTYTVIDSRDKGKKLDLLHDVSGYLRPGEMSALMGPSGSGKTTLLDLLAGRKTVGQSAGEIAFGGHRPTSMFLRRFTGYVEQFDTLVPVLTVREMLMYTAELKRPRSEPVEAKAEAVEELLGVLALHTCAGVQIGSSMARGISGGQAKRVNIGIALVANPRVLFLDEPTSGLDSYTASEVMSVVKSLSRQGITVCATIHSPTPYCFSLFDRLLLLLGGKQAYSGPNGKTAIDYFKNSAVCKGVAALAPGQNEAEWIVDLTVKADRQGRAGELAEAFAGSERRAEEHKALEAALGSSEALDPQVASELAVRRSTVTPFWHALWVLLKYRTSRNYRDPSFIMPRLADKVLFSFIIATLYLHVGKNLSSTNVVNLSSLIFISVVLPAYGASAYVPSLVLDRPLFLRERADGLYRVITYLVHRIVEEATLAIPLSVGVAALIFYPVELQGSFFAFWLVYLVTLLIGIMLGYMIASISKNMDVANAALPTYVTVLLFFVGVLLRWAQMPSYWSWFSYLNFLRYAWGSLMVNQFKGDRDVQFLNGQTVLEYYSLDGINQWAWLGFEIIFFFVFFAITFLALSYIRWQKR